MFQGHVPGVLAKKNLTMQASGNISSHPHAPGNFQSIALQLEYFYRLNHVELHEAVCVLGRKLAKGVFYRETGRIFPDEGCLLMNWFTNADLIRDGKYIVFDVLKEVSGDAPPTVRTGKYLGDQFEYKLSLAPDRNVFILQARFGGAFGFAIFGSTVLGLLEAGIIRLREQSSHSGPFAILQSPTLG